MTERPVISVDADLVNADWTKQTWDLGVETVEDLRAYLEAKGDTVAAFKQRPVYRLNLKARPWLRDL